MPSQHQRLRSQTDASSLDALAPSMAPGKSPRTTPGLPGLAPTGRAAPLPGRGPGAPSSAISMGDLSASPAMITAHGHVGAAGSFVQAKGELRGPSVHETASRGVSGSGGALPHLDRIQQSFGDHDLSGVRAHSGGAASQAAESLGANAYTMGESVAFNGGGDLHTAAHEAAHVVQQRQGVSLSGGVGAVGDAYERNADAVADRVVAGQSAADLLGPTEAKVNGPAVQRQARVVQFDLRETLRNNHEARGTDTPDGGSGGVHGTFQDMPENDPGPTISHDHGHLDDGSGNLDESLREDPTWADHLERLKWIAKLEGAELLRPDLVDGTAAYRHFLFGNGATRDIHYARFLNNDSSGATVLASAIEDTRQAALERSDQDLAGAEPAEGTQSYSIRTNPIAVASGDARYPYPATENWQKAIGAHHIWIEAEVRVTITEVPGPVQDGPDAGAPPEGEEAPPAPPRVFTRSFDIQMTIHAEDMYNFNPGDEDIASGTPDAVNGRFEVTGLGHEYLNTGTYEHGFEFEATLDPVGSPEHTAGENDPGRSSREGSTPGSRGRATER